MSRTFCRAVGAKWHQLLFQPRCDTSAVRGCGVYATVVSAMSSLPSHATSVLNESSPCAPTTAAAPTEAFVAGCSTCWSNACTLVEPWTPQRSCANIMNANSQRMRKLAVRQHAAWSARWHPSFVFCKCIFAWSPTVSGSVATAVFFH